LGGLQDKLGWRFEKIGLLEQALTHASASSAVRRDNERLEFLGDRVLGLLTAEALLETFPSEAEGALAPRLNALVCKESLATVAQSLGLGGFLRLGRSEAMTGGRKKAALLANAMEAVIAAVYLDGGLDAARTLYQRHWSPRLTLLDETPVDSKTSLQEWAQARGMPPPDYLLKERSGPDHEPVFSIVAVLESGESAVGVGGSKRVAEQAAAAVLFSMVAKEV
jgi:ribonuclease-3